MQYELWEIDPSHKGTLLDPEILTDKERDRWLDLTLSTLDVLPHQEWLTMKPPMVHGVYFQYDEGREIYIGKSSGIRKPSKSVSVAARLYTHRETCHGRWDIFPERMTYKVIPVDHKLHGHILLLEQYAIEHFRPKWNGTGYGSADPGKGRSGQGPTDFELKHPRLGTPEAEAKQRERDCSLSGMVD